MNTNRNAFQKIYDELKYLCKIATTGSKEEKALLKAKKIFDDVYSKGETNSVEGVKYAVSNWSEQKNQTQAEITINYQRTVDNVLRGNYNGDSSVIMGYTPSIYQEMGMPSLPFVIGTGHIYSTAKTKSEAIQENKYNKKNNYHGLGKQTVKNLYEAVKDPVMIISSKDVKPNAKPLRSTHSIVSIVDVGTNGKHLLLPIEITATRTVNGNKMDVNVLSSAYKRDVTDLIKEAVALENTGDVGFYYMKNGDTTIADSGVQFPVHLNNRISPNGIIRNFSEKVNMNLSDVTQSQQFKRWFGDWQNRPQKASKVVNEDGTPLIMYHGTNSDAFTVFDSTKSDKKVKLNTLGDGYYFTKSKERASRYGENIIETYLDIKKPYRVYPRDGGIKAQIEEDFGISADSLHRNDIQNILKSNGYDGILLHYSKYNDSDWETAVVFEPTQIKSATDNVGTYDKNNPNINYSLSSIAPETAPGGTLKITSDDVTLKAPKVEGEAKTENVLDDDIPIRDDIKKISPEDISSFAEETGSKINYQNYTQNDFETNAKTLVSMKSVKDLTGNEFKKEGNTTLKEKVMAFFNRLGNKIYSERFGDVDLTLSSFRSEAAHGWTKGKIISFEAIPEVIQNGVVIDSQRRGNGNYDRIVVAAPITIAGEDYYMGVMLQRDNKNQRLYLHDVITKEKASVNESEHLSSNRVANEADNLFMTSILQKAVLVNSKDMQNHKDISPISSEIKERSWVKTATESDVVGGQIIPEDLSEEARTYVPVSNEKTLDTARENLIKDGYEKAVNKAVSLTILYPLI